MPEQERPETIFVTRPDVQKDWRSKWLLSKAAMTPGSRFMLDESTAEAQRFGARVIGTMYFSTPAQGKLLFDGGITLGRGHEGDNDAADALRKTLTGQLQKRAETAVFGCSIRNEQTASGTMNGLQQPARTYFPPPDTQHARALLDRHLQRVLTRTDRLFAWFLAGEWLAVNALVHILSPRSWAGSESFVHLHVWAALVLGSLFAFGPDRHGHSGSRTEHDPPTPPRWGRCS